MIDATYKLKLKDQFWRLNNLYYLKDADGNKTKFHMRLEQKALFDGMWYLNIILKARQLGVTTFIQIFMLDRCLFNSNTSAGVIAHTKEDAESFFEDKIKFAYDNLPEDLKTMVSASTDNARELSFSNGSRIRVGTSMRSGTLQYLHISEFGKLCATSPNKATEVITGSLNTVKPGNFVFIESTAEGPHGKFFTMCNDAMKNADAAEKGHMDLTKMDYKFWFFPWFNNPIYELHGVKVHLDDNTRDYFNQLEAEEGVVLSEPKRAWYIKKAAEQGDKMKQEYPATPQEAFLKLLKGVIFAEQIRKARKELRICKLPLERGIPVNTFWDLGRNDFNAIWFHQRVGAWDHFIYYYEYRLVDLTYYAEQLRDFKEKFGWIYGDHYLPHDVKVTDISSKNNESREDILKSNGVKPIVTVPRIDIKIHAIELARKAFSRCRFDVAGCEIGIRRLEEYRWTWDAPNETFRHTPQKGDANHGADAFQQFGQGYRGPRGTMREQIEAMDGTGGRKYARGRNTRNPLTNPSIDHIL